MLNDWGFSKVDIKTPAVALRTKMSLEAKLKECKLLTDPLGMLRVQGEETTTKGKLCPVRHRVEVPI